VSDPDGWLTVTADRDALDAYVVALGRAGVAVRSLELHMTALESMFYVLTGERSDPVMSPAPNEIEAVP
jgi:ABC-2 type transport system ATP-binding protein